MKILPLVLALLLPSCYLSRSARNQAIDPSIVASLVPGSSTAADVARALGAPIEVVQLGHRSAWRYEYTVEKQAALWAMVIGLHGLDSQADRVWVFFDEKEILTHVGATFASQQADYKVPGQEGR